MVRARPLIASADLRRCGSPGVWTGTTLPRDVTEGSADQRASKTGRGRHFLRCSGIPIIRGDSAVCKDAGIFQPLSDVPKPAETSSSAWITGTRSFNMSLVIVCHARFLKLGVDSYLYVMEGGQHGSYNIGEHMTPEGARYGILHRPVVPTASLTINARKSV
jgi:hypothetical protein